MTHLYKWRLTQNEAGDPGMGQIMEVFLSYVKTFSFSVSQFPSYLQNRHKSM
jgi:hypothetical protein